MKTTRLSKLVLKGIAIVGPLLFVSCNADDAPVDYLYAHCATCNSKAEVSESLIALDTIVFSLPDEFGVIDPNIPPKKVGEHLCFKTKLDYLLFYDFNDTDSISKPIRSVKLPEIHAAIADYDVASDQIIHLTTHNDTNFLFRFEVNKNRTTEVLNDADTRWDAMPFVGMTFNRWKNKYILPFIPMDHYNEGRYLSVFDDQFKFEKSLGYGRSIGQNDFAPLFETPLISRIFKDGTFYASYSSGEQVVKCSIKGDWSIVYSDSICFPKSITHQKAKTIPKSKLGDFATLRKEHTCGKYVIRILADEARVYRIIKGEQEEINPKTRKIRTMIDAPWILETYDKKKRSFGRKSFVAQSIVFACSFNKNNKEYFLSYDSLDTNKVIFVAF